MGNQPFNIQDYCRRFETALLNAFGDKVLYIGLQGSYLRGEATDRSDIDIMVILETLTVADMDTYRRVLSEVGDADRACGFMCSRADMAAWNRLEICSLAYSTRDLYGKLADFLPPWRMADEIRFIQMSLDNLYHALCHGYIHASREAMREGLLGHYKSAFFILQNTHFADTCRRAPAEAEFILRKADLVEKLEGADRAVMETLLSFSSDESDFDTLYARLFSWCQSKMAEVGAWVTADAPQPSDNPRLALFVSAAEQDPAPVVICDRSHTIVYMNPAAVAHYERQGGASLVGQSLMDCHTPRSREAIERVVAWFAACRENNRIYTYRNDTENKDVYMIALRDTDGTLIGYYEKHEYRNRETAALYDFSRSLV